MKIYNLSNVKLPQHAADNQLLQYVNSTHGNLRNSSGMAELQLGSEAISSFHYTLCASIP